MTLLGIENGGHSWPGADTFGTPCEGAPTKAVNANDEIWSFFVTHPKL